MGLISRVSSRTYRDTHYRKKTTKSRQNNVFKKLRTVPVIFHSHTVYLTPLHILLQLCTSSSRYAVGVRTAVSKTELRPVHIQHEERVFRSSLAARQRNRSRVHVDQRANCERMLRSGGAQGRARPRGLRTLWVVHKTSDITSRI